jgi:N-acetylneuraminic acid mutarotase
VQIYDPETASWSLGTPAPQEMAAAVAAVVDGRILVAGGFLPSTGTTTDAAWAYEPGPDRWTALAPMPAGRNHAFGGTDGERLWVFGGRGSGNGEDGGLAEGFDDVQVYDPRSGAWRTSFDADQPFPPMPRRAAQGGRAVSHRGEFLLIGGVSVDAQGRAKLERRVDAFHPASGTWRREADLPLARAGSDPVLADRSIWSIGGFLDAIGTRSAAALRFRR